MAWGSSTVVSGKKESKPSEASINDILMDEWIAEGRYGEISRYRKHPDAEEKLLVKEMLGRISTSLLRLYAAPTGLLKILLGSKRFRI